MIARTDKPKERMKLSISQAKMREARARQMGRHFEAAQTTGYNNKHWLKADGRDINTIVTEALPVLRNRCRYEKRNNCWATGAITTLADAIVGPGPRLQVLSESKGFNKSFEARFSEWAGDKKNCDMRAENDFGEMVRMAGVNQQCDSGESLIILSSRPRDRYPIKLRLFMVESDRLATPFEKIYNVTVRDGVELDKYGKAIAYWIRESHPGNYLKVALNKAIRVPAENVIHLRRHTRPGQVRGYPLLTPALKPLAQLRDYTANVLVAADIFARLTGVIQATEEMDVSSDESYEAFDAVEIETGSFTTLPSGMTLKQAEPKQPSATYEMFVAEKLKEVGRAFVMPYNVISGDSSKYNYASGRLDKQIWWKYITGYQSFLEKNKCNIVVRQWLKEALLIPGYIDMCGLSFAEAMRVKIDWFWPGIEHVDPYKEAKAQEVRLKSKVTTLSDEYARKGQDWEEKLRQLAREVEVQKELGLLDEKGAKEAMENIARAVRAGVPVGVSEARVALGLSEEPPEGKQLRFNDQDVLQYHIESGVLTINEVRNVLGLPDVDWGNVPVRKTGVAPVQIKSVETDTEAEDEDKQDEK